MVGAVDEKGEKTSFSNYDNVDLVAEGMNIISSGPEEEYYYWEGTSQAVPVVGGVIAMPSQNSHLQHIMKLN